jgi:SulP family sulfate permease
MEIIERYALKLSQVGSKLVIVSAADRVIEQLGITGVTEVVGQENVYPSDEWLGATLERAYADARAWVDQRVDS